MGTLKKPRILHACEHVTNNFSISEVIFMKSGMNVMPSILPFKAVYHDGTGMVSVYMGFSNVARYRSLSFIGVIWQYMFHQVMYLLMTASPFIIYLCYYLLSIGQRKKRKLKWRCVDHVVAKAEYSKCQNWEQIIQVHLGGLKVVCWIQENLLSTLMILRTKPLHHCQGDCGQMMI
jgi:hypothetical protein